MFARMKEKVSTVCEKINSAKAAVITFGFIMSSNVYAQTAQDSATALQGTLSAFLNLMPIVSRLAGVVVMIGGLWSLYKYYKSQGRDGSVAAGLAGIVVGVGLFFLGGLLTFGADTLGIDQQTNLPGG